MIDWSVCGNNVSLILFLSSPILHHLLKTPVGLNVFDVLLILYLQLILSLLVYLQLILQCYSVILFCYNITSGYQRYQLI